MLKMYNVDGNLIHNFGLQGQSLIKVNPLYHKHVYSIVSRHTLKHTMQQFKHKTHQKPSGKPKKPKPPKRSRQKLSTKPSRKPNKNKNNNTTFRPMSTLADIGLTVAFVVCVYLFYRWF